MKTYPYIGKGIDSNNVVLFSSDKYGMCLSGVTCSTGMSGAWNEGAFKNVTPEYLQNTYGEVQSPEHAEFIIELAKNAGFDIWRSRDDINPVSFTIARNELQLFELGLKNLSLHGYKQITIPLPPKADKEEHSSKPIKIGDEVETNLGTGHIRLMPDVNDNYIVLINGHHIPVNTVNVKKLEAPKQELSEWPQVGDEFIHEGDLVTCISKGFTSDGGEVITFEGADKLSHGSCWNNDAWVKKPKTPEEELHDDLRFDVGFLSSTYEKPSIITEKLLEKYDIKKKPQ